MQGSELQQPTESPNSIAVVYSDTDARFYRATFKVRYPKDNLVFPDKRSLESLKTTLPGYKKHEVLAKHVHLAVREAKIEKVSWVQCRFHWPQDTKISDIKIQSCDFNQCFFGSVEFNRITFRDCNFIKCEFSYSRFVECSFENCSWEECTLWDTHFQGSLVNPDELLKGFCIPRDNLITIDDAVKYERMKMLLQSRVDLAEQLSRSNDERRSPLYSDRSISAYRRESLKLRSDKRKAISIYCRWYHWLRDFPSVVFFHLTNGGVSLKRLLLLALSIIAILTIALRVVDSDILYRGVDVNTSFYKCIEGSLALLLAFGYENFTTADPVKFPSLLVIIPILGIFWLSLILAVVVRRVYR